MRVCVVLVNWNNAADTIACVESMTHYLEGENPPFSTHLVIVDNGSSDQSYHLIDRFLKNNGWKAAVLLRNPVNAGYAGGHNQGIRYALDNFQTDYFWLLNNDTVVEKDCLEKLVVAACQYPDYVVWGSTIFDFYDSRQLQCAGGFQYNAVLSIPSPLTFPNDKIPKGLHYHQNRLDYISGVSMFVKAECFRQHGLLTEDYFLYYEELELTRKVGGSSRLAWCPDSVVYHKGGSSTGSKDPNRGMGSFQGHYWGNLSALKYTWRHHRRYFPIVFGFRLFAKSLLFVRYGEWKAFRPMLKAFLSFVRWLMR